MLQGSRHAHITALEQAANESNTDIEVVELRSSSDLISSEIDGIIIPGGESTTMRLIGNSNFSGLLPSLMTLIRDNPHIPVMGTCAGAILLTDPQDEYTSLIDASIDRNAYGTQTNSFQADVQTSLLKMNFPGVFIRAPKFRSVNNPNSIIATCNGEVVGVRKNNLIALTFHPELSKNRGFHSWLIGQAVIYSEGSK